MKIGHVEIRIRQYADGRWGFDDYSRGQRSKVRVRKKSRAQSRAADIAVLLANGRDDLLRIDRAELAEFRRWKSGRTSNEHRVFDLVQQLVSTRRDHKLSDKYVRSLSNDLVAFSKSFPTYINEIRSLQIQSYLRDLGVGDRRRNNIRDVIVTLFLFAKEHGDLPQDRITEAEKVKRIDLEHGAPRIYTPAQLRVILEHVSPEWIDWICCQAFAGIRPEEAGRPHLSKKTGEHRKLMWTDFLWDERQIRIVALISKTGRDRYITMNDTFLAWCGHHRGEISPVCTHDRPDRETGRLGELLGFDWISDGLRHSYASYWQSLHKDMARLKEEMGNSEQVNRRFYYHPQPESIAKSWWSVLPDHQTAGGKITQMPLAMTFR
jgi:hypothetical protein